MDVSGRGRRRCRCSEALASSNPVRNRMVELVTADETRPLMAPALATDLATMDQESPDVSVSQVGYYLACLRDAKLIPLGPTARH
jgi:hypothetical protein